jgi:hypothetical protein
LTRWGCQSSRSSLKSFLKLSCCMRGERLDQRQQVLGSLRRAMQCQHETAMFCSNGSCAALAGHCTASVNQLGLTPLPRLLHYRCLAIGCSAASCCILLLQVGHAGWFRLLDP